MHTALSTGFKLSLSALGVAALLGALALPAAAAEYVTSNRTIAGGNPLNGNYIGQTVVVGASLIFDGIVTRVPNVQVDVVAPAVFSYSDQTGGGIAAYSNSVVRLQGGTFNQISGTGFGGGISASGHRHRHRQRRLAARHLVVGQRRRCGRCAPHRPTAVSSKTVWPAWPTSSTARSTSTAARCAPPAGSRASPAVAAASSPSRAASAVAAGCGHLHRAGQRADDDRRHGHRRLGRGRRLGRAHGRRQPDGPAAGRHGERRHAQRRRGQPDRAAGHAGRQPGVNGGVFAYGNAAVNVTGGRYTRFAGADASFFTMGSNNINFFGTDLALSGPTAGSVFELNSYTGNFYTFTSGTFADGQSAVGLRLFDATSVAGNALGGGYTLNPAAAVPEPQAWLLLALALPAIGAAVRRRTRA